MAVAPISYQPQQAFSGGADFSQLANLGNVYRDAQAAQAKRAALANLGTDPQANLQTLLTSGDPALAQIGLNLQQKGIEQGREDARYSVTDARANAELGLRQAAGRREQGSYDQAEQDRLDAAKLISGYGAPPAQPAAPTAPSPAPSGVVRTNPDGSIAGNLTAPLEPAAAPEQAAAPPADDMVGRATRNLTSSQPVAAAGLSRQQLGEMYANPLTRPLATALLQKQSDPGAWTYTKLDDGRLIATNNRDPNQVKDVTPSTASGAPAATSQEREVQGYFQAGKKLGMTDEQATAYAANKGKTPNQDLRPGEETRINKLTDEARTAQRTLDGVAQLRVLSPEAWGGPGAETASKYWSALPAVVPGVESAVKTQDLINAAHNNVVNVARTYFPQRVTNMDVNLLQDLEGSAGKSDAVRQKIYNRVEKVMSKIVEESNADAEAIRNKSFYRPGGGTAPAAAPATAAPAAPATAAPTAAPPTAKPSLGEFMRKARETNPGYSDGEIAREWKQRYGG